MHGVPGGGDRAEVGGLRLRLSAARTVRVLAVIAAVLVVAGALGAVARVGFGHGRLHGLVPLVDLDAEANLPATYAAALLAMSALVLWLLGTWRAQAGLSDARLVRLLSLLVLAMAVDEASQIHELLSDPVRSALGLGGPLYYAWVVVYGAVLVVLAAVLLPRAARLEPVTRRLVLIAAGLYVGGALGLELAGSAVVDAGGRGGWGYAALTTVEEGLEFAGALVLLYALLRALGHACGAVSARVVVDAPAPSPARPRVPASGADVRVG